MLVLVPKTGKFESRFHCGSIIGKNNEFSFIHIKLNDENGAAKWRFLVDRNNQTGKRLKDKLIIYH